VAYFAVLTLKPWNRRRLGHRLPGEI